MAGDLFGRTAIEMAMLAGMNIPATSKFTDGTFPYNFWVTKGGADGLGNGSFQNPFLTIRRAIREMRDGRGDRALVGPGSYAENPDIGAGDTSYGSNGGYQKKNAQIIGTGGLHNGVTQIVGDGVTATATLRVQAGYLRGFKLANVELDSSAVSGEKMPAAHFVTSDSGALTATSGDYHFLVENVAIRSAGPDVGFLFEGAQMGRIKRCTIQGPTIGLAFTGSALNNPVDLEFEDIDFRDCVTADMATVTGAANGGGARTTIVARPMTNISFLRLRHWDRGGTPVTNYVNFPDSPVGGSPVNVGGFHCWWARDVADNTLMVLPADVFFVGHSAAGVESIIGA